MGGARDGPALLAAGRVRHLDVDGASGAEHALQIVSCAGPYMPNENAQAIVVIVA